MKTTEEMKEMIEGVIKHIEFMKVYDTTPKKLCLNKIIDELNFLKRRIEK